MKRVLLPIAVAVVAASFIFNLRWALTHPAPPVQAASRAIITSAHVPSRDVRVYAMPDLPAEVPLDLTGKLHLFCSRKGHLIAVYEKSLAVVPDGCK